MIFFKDDYNVSGSSPFATLYWTGSDSDSDSDKSEEPEVLIFRQMRAQLYNPLEFQLKDLNIQTKTMSWVSKFKTMDARLNSFKNWPPSLSQRPAKMAEAGFFYDG